MTGSLVILLLRRGRHLVEVELALRQVVHNHLLDARRVDALHNVQLLACRARALGEWRACPCAPSRTRALCFCEDSPPL